MPRHESDHNHGSGPGRGGTCPECGGNLHVKETRCPYCETVLMDTLLDLDDDETEELIEELEHGLEDEMEDTPDD